jgi:hypothetical protein
VHGTQVPFGLHTGVSLKRSQSAAMRHFVQLPWSQRDAVGSLHSMLSMHATGFEASLLPSRLVAVQRTSSGLSSQPVAAQDGSSGEGFSGHADFVLSVHPVTTMDAKKNKGATRIMGTFQ